MTNSNKRSTTVRGDVTGERVKVIVFSCQGIVPPRSPSASQLPRTISKWDGRSPKGSENDCGVAELLPRCERLMLYRLGNVPRKTC